jgi:hypothetical protein
LLFDNVITLARFPFEGLAVKYMDDSPGIFDKPAPFESGCGNRNRGPGTSQHIGKEHMRDRKTFGPGTIGTEEEPAGESLFDLMFGVATGKLRGLGQLRLDIS